MITNLTEYKEFIKNKKIAVIGLGISNQALIRFLNDCGAFNISVFDKTTLTALLNYAISLYQTEQFVITTTATTIYPI